MIPVQIPIVTTLSCKGEVRTDGHAPVKFVCDDGALYYCKYRKRWLKEEEIDYLRYELVATHLLKELGIRTPDVAFVRVSEGAHEPDMMPNNRENVQPGVVMFGSRQTTGSLVEMHRFNSPALAAELEDPADLVRIAAFDVWAGNADRGRPLQDGLYNFNLLLGPAGPKLRFIAFDHAFLFNGEGGHGQMLGDGYHHLYVSNTLLGTPLFRDVLKYLGDVETGRVLEEFIVRLRSLKGTSPVHEVMRQADEHWPHRPGLAERMESFLWDGKRLDQLSTGIRNHLGL